MPGSESDAGDQGSNLEEVVVENMKRSSVSKPSAADTSKQLAAAMALYDLTDVKAFWVRRACLFICASCRAQNKSLFTHQFVFEYMLSQVQYVGLACSRVC